MCRYRLAKPVCLSVCSWVCSVTLSGLSMDEAAKFVHCQSSNPMSSGWVGWLIIHLIKPRCSFLRQREVRLSLEHPDLSTLIPIANLTTSCRRVHPTALQRSTAFPELTLSQDFITPLVMAGANLKAPVAAAATSSPGSPRAANTKWNEEAHRALIGTLLDVMDSADTKWRAHLDLMVENLAERGQQFSREGIR